MPGPRKKSTLRLEAARGQFFQWYFVENLPLPVVKNLMDQLSEDLVKITGESFSAPKKDWAGRRNYWNKRSQDAWGIEGHQRGPNVTIPPDLHNVKVWRANGKDVGDWAGWLPVKPTASQKLQLSEVAAPPSDSSWGFSNERDGACLFEPSSVDSTCHKAPFSLSSAVGSSGGNSSRNFALQHQQTRPPPTVKNFEAVLRGSVDEQIQGPLKNIHPPQLPPSWFGPEHKLPPCVPNLYPCSDNVQLPSIQCIDESLSANGSWDLPTSPWASSQAQRRQHLQETSLASNLSANDPGIYITDEQDADGVGFENQGKTQTQEPATTFDPFEDLQPQSHDTTGCMMGHFDEPDGPFWFMS